ncbi:hypothetical protein, partial [Bacteroides nordii]|uniref:hypothetical protein n=1 Tax=Bacteroides nordii TaxID=291645 RepID=UPI002599AD4F
LTVNQRVLGSSPRGRAKKSVFMADFFVFILFNQIAMPPLSFVELIKDQRKLILLSLFSHSQC